MVSGLNFPAVLRDERWRYAAVAGFLMLPLIVEQAVQTPQSYEYSPVFYAGVIAGFLYDGERTETKRVGAVAGCVAALPTVLALRGYALDLVGYDGALWFKAAAALLVLSVHVLFFAFAPLLGMLGALLGRWIVGKTGRPRLPGVHA